MNVAPTSPPDRRHRSAWRPLAALWFALLAVPIDAGLAPSLGGLEHDYILPSPAALSARATAIRPLPGAAFGDGERVSYRAFDGTVYALTRFRGRHVALLLPDSWLGGDALDEPLVRSFLDRSDLVYAQLLDLVGVEPAGAGLLPIAIVPQTCGWGCGFVGSKGIEIADIPSLNPVLWRDVAADQGVGVLIHELTHNFDVFAPYLAYLPDQPHAWTGWVGLYYFVYTREGQTDATPEEVARDWLATTAPYFADPAASWELCVRDGRCGERGINARDAWAGLGFRIFLLDGPRAARGVMAFLRDYRVRHRPPASTEGKNDLYLEALAAGSGRNLACVADTWRWHLSRALRSRLNQLYPAANPDCADRDRDGATPLTGDCDDRNGGVRPGALERQDGRDNDCDGRIDETLWREPPGGDFLSPRPFKLPAEIVARISDPRDADPYTFRLATPGRVRLELCSRPDFQGWLFLYDTAGAERDFRYVFAGLCTRAAWNLDAAWWRFDVVLNAASQPGGYAIEIHRTAPWPAPPWAHTAVPRASGGRFELTAAALAPEDLPARPTSVRFWVSGHGIVATVPYAPSVSWMWNPPAGSEPSRLAYRAQLLLRGSVPAYDWTPARPFPP